MEVFQNTKKIHFIGIGGIGISAIAKIALKEGKIVSGSDMVISEIIKDLEKRKAKIFIGHQKENLTSDTDLVIYSPAVPVDNPERQKAAQLKIPQLNYPEVLGKISKNKWTIAVSGTNGKTTTTALLGLILEKAGFDPLVVVGSKVKTFPGENLREGSGKYFVVEACEWRANMLNLHPQAIVLTNIEEDHLDYYRGLKHITETFQKYISKLPAEGLLVFNNDDFVSSQKLKKPDCQIVTYGIKNKADLMAKNMKTENGQQYFELIYSPRARTTELSTEPSNPKTKTTGIALGRFTLSIPGCFNIYNALAATACALTLGIAPEIIKDVLADFRGLWRRFEKIGERQGAIIISDYAHHPTAVRETIQAAREFYPNRRIIAVFQPHHYNRTKKLFDDFVKSFDQADLIILSEIFEVAGREDKKDGDVSSKDLVKAIQNRTIQAQTIQNQIIQAIQTCNNFFTAVKKLLHNSKLCNSKKKILFGKNLKETKKLISENLEPNDLILIMGAGDIYKIL